MAFTYPFKLAVRSLLQEKWINLLSMLTIAAGLFFAVITILSLYNIERATRKLPEKFSVMLYLKDNLSREEIDVIIDTAMKDVSVEKVKYIPREDALKELKSSLKDTEYVLDGLGENPLPDAIEVKLKSASVGPETVKRLTARLQEAKGVHDIEYGEKFLSSIYSIRVGMQAVGIVFLIILSSGMLFVCYSTVKILFYRKEKEIETFKLLGATKGFIRTPFLIEGAVIGLAGGFLCLAGILSFYYLFILKLSLTFPLFYAIIFPLDLSFFIPPAGLLIGIIGAYIAIGRIRY
jgi:cell division transport system permease protein